MRTPDAHLAGCEDPKQGASTNGYGSNLEIAACLSEAAVALQVNPKPLKPKA